MIGLSKPFLKSEQLIGYYVVEDEGHVSVEELLENIKSVKHEVKDENVLISLDVIEQEILKNDYRIPVIVGMMSNLQNHAKADVLLNKLTAFIESSSN